MLISEPPLQILPTLAVAIGLNEALFLQQLHYWVRLSPHRFEGRCWVYNSYEGWLAQFPFWSESTLRRIIRRLEAPLAGSSAAVVLSTTRFNQRPTNQIKWYTIDYEQLDQIELYAAVSPEPMSGDDSIGQVDRMGWSD